MVLGYQGFSFIRLVLNPTHVPKGCTAMCALCSLFPHLSSTLAGSQIKPIQTIKEAADDLSFKSKYNSSQEISFCGNYRLQFAVF